MRSHGSTEKQKALASLGGEARQAGWRACARGVQAGEAPESSSGDVRTSALPSGDGVPHARYQGQKKKRRRQQERVGALEVNGGLRYAMHAGVIKNSPTLRVFNKFQGTAKSVRMRCRHPTANAQGCGEGWLSLLFSRPSRCPTSPRSTCRRGSTENVQGVEAPGCRRALPVGLQPWPRGACGFQMHCSSSRSFRSRDHLSPLSSAAMLCRDSLSDLSEDSDTWLM